jgi:hypothetical protein
MASRPQGIFRLPPLWYTEAKARNATPAELYAMVSDFCQQSGNEMPGDDLVKLMIATYEADTTEEDNEG